MTAETVLGENTAHERKPLRLPEPMTEQQIYNSDELMAINGELAGMMLRDLALVVQAIETVVLRLVKEANK